MFRILRSFLIVLVWLLNATQVFPLPPGKLALPPDTSIILDHIYEGRRDLALTEIRHLQEQSPEDPLGYLLEAEVEWWRIWCVSAEFKYGMTMARHHAKAPGDEHYLELTAKAYKLAEAKIRQHDSGDMRLYAALADALAARFYGIRSESRASARAGVRARENFIAALALDPTLFDAYTLSMLARAMRFLMGIPGGSKEEGIQQLRRGMQEGQISAALARYYLALNLFNYDQRYEDALQVIAPLADKYPQNPMFQLMRGDLEAKLGRKQLAEASYRAADAAAATVPEEGCRAKIKQLVQQSLRALGQMP
jgi:hypothetical protein